MAVCDLPCYVEGFDPELNLRDLGGWQVRDGRRVRRGFVYRSSRLDVLDTSELVRLQQLGLSCVVDLRPREESKLHPDPRFPSIRFVRADAGRDPLDAASLQDASPSEVIEAMTRKTAAMAFGNAGASKVLSLLGEGVTPLLFHCNSGRDRSGVVAMIVLLALGCSDEVILEDYLLTNAYRAQSLEELEERYAGVLALGEEYRQLVTVMAGVLPQAGRAVLDAIDDAYPSPERYLKEEFGLDQADIERLRNRLLA